TRTWLAADACGNTNTCQQSITVVLPTPPTIASQPGSVTIPYGNNSILSVSAAGTGPLTYQWQCNGTNLAGATGSSLSLNSVQFANAGIYNVVVSNSAGSVTSAITIVNVAPRLFHQFSGHTLT